MPKDIKEDLEKDSAKDIQEDIAADIEEDTAKDPAVGSPRPIGGRIGVRNSAAFLGFSALK